MSYMRNGHRERCDKRLGGRAFEDITCAHELRLDRLERAFEALLEDIAHNPLTAVEMARSYLSREIASQ